MKTLLPLCSDCDYGICSDQIWDGKLNAFLNHLELLWIGPLLSNNPPSDQKCAMCGKLTHWSRPISNFIPLIIK